MPRVHLLNVSPGDCTIIEHASGRVSVMDVCSGNQRLAEDVRKSEVAAAERSKPRGNFGMCATSTDPIEYLKSMGVRSIFRFILSHPDMDHMDGIDRLFSNFSVANFWDTGSQRPKPDFDHSPYLEADWDRYDTVRSGKSNTTSAAIRQAGDKFAFANRTEDGSPGGDGLAILAPTKELINDPDFEDDINEGSYVISYNSVGGRILLPGDAHDVSWDHIIANDVASIQNTAFLLAPHHGRDSDRSYDFLDHMKPNLTLLGCAPSQYIDYGQWSRRNLDCITSNQAGNVVLEISDKGIDVYIENRKYVEACGKRTDITNALGYTFFKAIPK